MHLCMYVSVNRILFSSGCTTKYVLIIRDVWFNLKLTVYLQTNGINRYSAYTGPAIFVALFKLL